MMAALALAATLLATPLGTLGHGDGPLGISNRSYYTIVCIGDSITATVSGGGTPYSLALRNSITSRYTQYWNAGVAGNKSSDMLTRWSGGIRGSVLNAVTVLGGVNDANADVAAATAFANLQTIYDNAHSDGLLVVAMTVMPEKNFVSWTSGRQTIIDAINTSIRAYVIANPSNTVLVDLYSLMGDTDPQALKAAYDSGDGLHPNQTGSNVIAAQMKTALGL